MDRILLGKSPEVEADTSSTYYRAGNTGLFISKPRANVLSCSDGDLIFDSTAPDFMQVLETGTATIYSAGSLDTPTTNVVYTSTKTPYAEEKATVLVQWSSLTPSSNIHPSAYPSSWNTSHSESFVVVPPYLNLDHINLQNPDVTGVVSGYSLTAKTYANTETNNVDIEFINGSPYRSHTIAWTLYRVKGT